MSFYGDLVASIRSSRSSGSFTAAMAAEKLTDIDELVENNSATTLLPETHLHGTPDFNANDSCDTGVYNRMKGIVSFSESNLQSIGFLQTTGLNHSFRLGQTSQSFVVSSATAQQPSHTQTPVISQWVPANCPVAAMSPSDIQRRAQPASVSPQDDICEEALDEDLTEEFSEGMVEEEGPISFTALNAEVSDAADAASESGLNAASQPEQNPSPGYSMVFESFSADPENDPIMDAYYANIKKDVLNRQKSLLKKQQKNAKVTAPPTPRRRPVKKDAPQMATIGGVEIDLAEQERRIGTVGLVHTLMSGPGESPPHQIEFIKSKKSTASRKDKADGFSSDVEALSKPSGSFKRKATGSKAEAGAFGYESLSSPCKKITKRKRNSTSGKSFSAPQAKRRKLAQPEEDTIAPEAPIPSIETEELATPNPAPKSPVQSQDQDEASRGRSRSSSLSTLRSPTPELYKEHSPETTLHMAGIATHDWAYGGAYPNGGKPPRSPSPVPDAEQGNSFATEACSSAEGYEEASNESFNDGTFIAPADGTLIAAAEGAFRAPTPRAWGPKKKAASKTKSKTAFVAPAEGAFRAPSEDSFIAPADGTFVAPAEGAFRAPTPPAWGPKRKAATKTKANTTPAAKTTTKRKRATKAETEAPSPCPPAKKKKTAPAPNQPSVLSFFKPIITPPAPGGPRVEPSSGSSLRRSTRIASRSSEVTPVKPAAKNTTKSSQATPARPTPAAKITAGKRKRPTSDSSDRETRYKKRKVIADDLEDGDSDKENVDPLGDFMTPKANPKRRRTAGILKANKIA